MCSLCSDDPKQRKAAQDENERIATNLRFIAGWYSGLASGRIKPHDGAAPKQRALSAIRHLVEDFV